MKSSSSDEAEDHHHMMSQSGALGVMTSKSPCNYQNHPHISTFLELLECDCFQLTSHCAPQEHYLDSCTLWVLLGLTRKPIIGLGETTPLHHGWLLYWGPARRGNDVCDEKVERWMETRGLASIGVGPPLLFHDTNSLLDYPYVLFPTVLISERHCLLFWCFRMLGKRRATTIDEENPK